MTGLIALFGADAAWAGLPLVNLTVAWRLDDGSQMQGTSQVAQGQVILDSRGQVIGRTGYGATTVQTERSQQTAQMLQVLNGRQARLYVGRQVGRQSWQLVWAPYGNSGSGNGSSNSASTGSTGSTATSSSSTGNTGTGNTGTGSNTTGYGVQSQMVWVDLGDGLTVRPRWGGGHQPVLLDIEARSSRALQGGAMTGAGFEPDGQVGRTEVATTLAVPMGQWTVLARTGASRSASSSRGGTSLSTRDLDESGAMTLWVRVSTDRLDAPAPEGAP